MNINIYETEYGKIIVPKSILDKAKCLNIKFAPDNRLNDKRTRGAKYLLVTCTELKKQEWKVEK